jgi:hypothetical protein
LAMLLNLTLQLNFETSWHDSLSNPSLKINLSESCFKMTKSTWYVVKQLGWSVKKNGLTLKKIKMTFFFNIKTETYWSNLDDQ